MDLLLSKFRVAVEIQEFVSYVKMVDKRQNNSVNELSNTLYEQFLTKQNLSIEDIKEVINRYSNIFLVNLLKDEKFYIYYDVITNSYINEELIYNHNEDALFTLNIRNNDMKTFNKDEIQNYLSDKNQKDLFIIDVRHYGTNKKYMIVDFELYLNKTNLVIKSYSEEFAQYFLKQYNFQKILHTLGFESKNIYDDKIFYTKNSYEQIDHLLMYNGEEIKKNLKNDYLNNTIIFLNNKLLKNIGIETTDLIESSSTPKLIIELNHCEFDSVNYNRISNKVKFEIKGNLHILSINESLFREACGYNGHILYMIPTHYYALSAIDESIKELTFISKIRVNANKYFNSIIRDYSNMSKENNSYMEELFLSAFTLTSEELSRNFNYYIMSNLKTTDDKYNFKNRVHKDQVLSVKFLKDVMQLNGFLSLLNKSLSIGIETLEGIYNETIAIVSDFRDLKQIDEFVKEFFRFIKELDLEFKLFPTQIEKINKLVNLKKILLDKTIDINYLLDSSIFLQDPEIINKYLLGKHVIVPQIVFEKLDKLKGNNINASRALRNINSIKDHHINKIDIVYEIDTKGYIDKIDQEDSDRKIIELALNQIKDKKIPIILSNNDSLSTIANQEDIVLVSGEYLNLL